MRVLNKIMLFILIITYVSYGSDERTVSLDDCINIGLENNKTLKISNQKINSARAKIDEIDATRLPSLKFLGSYTRLSEVDKFVMPGVESASSLFPVILNNYALKLTVQQPLFTGFRLENNAELVRNSETITKYEYSKERNQLVYDIKTAFWNYYKAKENLRSIDSSLAQFKAHLKDIQNLKDNGFAMDNDVLKVQVQLSNTEMQRIEAANNVSLAMMSLNNALGISISTTTNLKNESPTTDYTIPQLTSVLDSARNRRPELKSSLMQIKAGQNSIDMTKSAWWPQVNLYGNVYYNNPNSRKNPQQPEFLATWDCGVSVSYDIWTWRQTSYQTQQAEASLEQAKYALEMSKDAIDLEVSQSYLNLIKCKEKIPVAERVVGQARENVRVTRERMLSGMALSSDMIDAEVALLQSEINLTASKADFELAKAKLEKATANF